MKKSKRQQSPHHHRYNNYSNGSNYKNNSHYSYNQGHYSRTGKEYSGGNANHGRYEDNYKKESEQRQFHSTLNSTNNSGTHPVELPIFIEYKHERIELGSTWGQINQTIDSKIGKDRKLATAIKLCIMSKVKGRIQISEQQELNALKEYANTME